MEGIAPVAVVPQTNNSNNTNTTQTVTTSTTSITTSVPTVTTEAPHENGGANPKSEAPETKPVKTDHKRKRETGLYN